MKVVINTCFGGFGLSRKALHRLREMGNKCAIEETDIGEKWPDSDKTRGEGLSSFCREIDRNDPMLVQVVEELGDEVNTLYSNLKIVEVPDDIKWIIEEYDGREWVAEEHREWS